MNDNAIRIPPATTNGSMLLTPSIRCLYARRPILSFAEESSEASTAPSCLYIGAFPSKIVWISSSGLLIPSATFVIIVGRPSKRATSTFLSAATMIPTALSISSFVSLFSTPI